ncbi:MAG: hypothetical protein IT177_11460 [Acidobacteria bacterium]|nr:hypothetical protein [Acidobacteriota bacterium]
MVARDPRALILAHHAAILRAMAKAKRTTHRSTAGKKLYAKRDSAGKFKDIQTYERAHRADLAKKSGAEKATAAKKAKKAAAKKAVKKAKKAKKAAKKR